MLEGLVAWVLNNYLGKYVENLNTDQLSVALLSGKVELENLPLKKDALRHLGLPVEIKAGFIGKVQLQVPVRQIRSAPWLIAIENLYLVAAPVNLDEWDSAVEAHIAHERKTALLDALEAQWRAEHEARDAGYYAASYSTWLSYGTGLLANIVENLQLKLTDVHIRYEDAVTCAPQTFACGLTVQSLTAESCDANWVRGFTLLADADCSFKLLELQQLAVYWDPMPPAAMMAACTLAELTERMRATWLCEHRYLSAPASARARVRRERCEQPLRSRTRPRLACHLTLPSVQLDLTSRQYSEVVGCVLGLERIARLREFRALRPDVPVRGHARAWWLYALRCHAPHHRWMDPKPTWALCAERARRTRRYVDICLGVLSNPAATLPPEEKAIKDEFEWNTPLSVLKPLREVAMRKVPIATPASTPEDAPASSGRSVLVRWFPLWWGWYAPGGAADAPAGGSEQPQQSQQPQLAAAPAAPAAPRLEEEILDVIADSLEDNTLLRRDTVFGLFEFTLERGSLNLTTEPDDRHQLQGAASPEGGGGGGGGTGVELQFSSVCVRVETRPRTGSHALHVSLGAVCLRERITPGTLFPVLVAPQGMIREGLSAMNAAASAAAWWRAQQTSAPTSPPAPAEPLFQLSYEKRPFGLNCDYKLWVKSMSLEVVYCAAAARWAQQFVAAPWGPRRTIAHVRDQTRARLLTHWEHMLRAHPVLGLPFSSICLPLKNQIVTLQSVRPGQGERRSWQVELDVSAPQILFVEQLSARGTAALLVDFGRLRLANAHFTEDAPLPSPSRNFLLVTVWCDWRQAERRVVHTSDPQYPSATLCGSLPALVVHLSEHKLAAVRAVAIGCRLPDLARESPSQEGAEVEEEEEDESSVSSETERSELSAHNNATLFMLQFAIDQMSLEVPVGKGLPVQSRGRSIAEVQVCGVKAALSARPCDLSLSLSVHSLLLVDALQTYGPDFELLVASHKHVGMDTASGSIRGSEPTSPTSPTSPASPDSRAAPAPPTPRALRHALRSLHRAAPTALIAPASLHEVRHQIVCPVGRATPPTLSTCRRPSRGPSAARGARGVAGAGGVAGAEGVAGATGAVWGGGNGWSAPGLVDTEALIAVEICLVKGDADSEDLRIANILFNNLDVIANQETIVELIGFAHRVLGPRAPHEHRPAPPAADVPDGPLPTPPPTPPRTPPMLETYSMGPMRKIFLRVMMSVAQRAVRTEITFDFHRLGVLLLRAAVLDGALVAKKIATATVGEARIQATLAARRLEVGGSLGGVQVVSLCEGAGLHTRVLAAGRAHAPDAPDDKAQALLFTITRDLLPGDTPDATVVETSVSVRVASVWYTQSGALLRELQSCLTEFKQYLANLARSIRAAAADMAIGLVHPSPRGESLYGNPRLAQSTEAWGRRRTVSAGATPPAHAPPPATATPSLDEADVRTDILLTVNIELESPVVVVPRAAHSTQVFVAHLGRMSLTNRPGAPRNTQYSVSVRDISLASLDVGERLRRQPLSAENMGAVYDVSCGRPVLHDTALQLTLDLHERDHLPHCDVSGAIVGALQVSASREQYEQLLDTLRWVADSAYPDVRPPSPAPAPAPAPASAPRSPRCTAQRRTFTMTMKDRLKD
ncbi:Vacuolar protein sorting-associated protein 13D [Papilio machaon]|uniref:Vacuolar protein sorting-associated protein 13D n=1 Tax=Papilio machaon TaxID=76193 RepID=A0A0N1IDC7_PAPMA|nr:Vacuolar protein sorting-associated protein 13D [Papilio machaon]